MNEEDKLHCFTVMKKNHVRAKDVAKQIGVSNGMLSLYLNNQTGMNQNTVNKLRQVIAELDQ
ncbi:LacI family DNA-binding transcriptional regulator [Rummeliibacillus stabekisii]|uniref:LacI family DNA-binding transcriptional regulator n=1 Tax=Rummeliibacillus stabekisii TaxID=241244 RepID=UPI00371F8197